MTTNYEKLKETKKQLEKVVYRADREINDFPARPDGTVSDEVRNSKEFKKAKAAFKKALIKLQDFNKSTSKEFKKKQSEERRASWRKNPEKHQKLFEKHGFSGASEVIEHLVFYKGYTKKKALDAVSLVITEKQLRKLLGV